MQTSPTPGAFTEPGPVAERLWTVSRMVARALDALPSRAHKPNATSHLVSCPRSLWTKRRAGRGAPPRNALRRHPHRALVRSHESEATASGNAQKPRCRGGAPRPARRRESTDFRDTTLVIAAAREVLEDLDPL